MGARIDLRIQHRAALFAGLALTFATAITACSSETNQRPPDNDFTTSSATSSSSTSATGTGGAGGGSTSSVTGAGGGGTGGAPPNCDGPNGCYSCPPKTGNQFLNACTGSQCSPFNN